MQIANLRSDIRFLIFNDSTDTSYSDIDIDRNINLWYRTILGWILTSNGDWQINGDYATTDIVANQREYVFDTDVLKLSEVYIKSTSTGEYIKARQRDILNVGDYPEDYHPATPEFDLLDNSLFIYIPEDTITDVTEGIKIYYQGELTELTGTAKPNLADVFVRGLAYGAGYDYCFSNEMWNKATKLEKILGIDQPVVDSGLKKEIKEFYASRSLTQKPIIKFKKKNFC